MRVGFLTYGLDRRLTGIGRYTVELAKALAEIEDGVGLTLLAAGDPRALTLTNKYRSAQLVGCRLLPALLTLGNVLVPRLAQHERLDLVHDPTGVTPLLFGAGPARTLVTVHDVFPWSCPGTSTLLDTLIYRYWLPQVLPRVDAVVTDSQTSRGDLVRYLSVPPEKIRVVPGGVSSLYRPSSPDEVAGVRARYGLPDKYLLFVGSVEERKNLRRLLQAYSLLCQTGETPPLVVVGASGVRSGLIAETRRQLNLEKQVLLTGYVSEADLPALYTGADVFVFPSLYEGFGLPPLEAMACGTPVICSNAASLPEVVGDAAVTVDPYDVEALAAAMRHVLSDAGLREELRLRGLARAKLFTWQETARKTVELYQAVCR